MSLDIAKLCVENLRIYARNELGCKLKAAHAHEIVAAVSGYNLAVLRSLSLSLSINLNLNILRTLPDKGSPRGRIKRRGWGNHFLYSLHYHMR
jgi:hypothetical protein